jgi:hypothetical protein
MAKAPKRPAVRAGTAPIIDVQLRSRTTDPSGNRPSHSEAELRFVLDFIDVSYFAARKDRHQAC